MSGRRRQYICTFYFTRAILYCVVDVAGDLTYYYLYMRVYRLAMYVSLVVFTFDGRSVYIHIIIILYLFMIIIHEIILHCRI